MKTTMSTTEKIAELEQRIERLEAALRFYSVEDSYKWGRTDEPVRRGRSPAISAWRDALGGK